MADHYSKKRTFCLRKHVSDKFTVSVRRFIGFTLFFFDLDIDPVFVKIREPEVAGVS